MKVKEFQTLPMSLNIKDDAIFVADSHYNASCQELLIFLKKLQSKEIETQQLFLMGDMFDFIAGECSYFINLNKDIISRINRLSDTLDIIYLEGNHDYNLKVIFPKIKVISRNEQPLYAVYKEQKVALSHGDIYVNDKFYDIYCSIIRNRLLLKFLNLFDFKGFLSKKIYNALIGHEICRKIDHFEEIVKKRVKHYHSDIIIEGHFHQGNEYKIGKKRYKNIPSLTCSQAYCVLKDNVFIGVKID